MDVLKARMNMVRAGAVAHPREWSEAGYHEIQQGVARYRIIDRAALCKLLGVKERNLAASHSQWIDSQLSRGKLEREPEWSEAVAVGRRCFAEQVQEELGARARYRRVDDVHGASILRDPEEAYPAISASKWSH
jgi:putative transposase